MNLHHLLEAREASGRPVTVGLIGAGKFGTMFLAQARRTPGLHVLAIADLDPSGVRTRLAGVNWPVERSEATSLDDAAARRSTFVVDDAARVIADPRIEVVVEATGNPEAGIRHALAAFAHGKHVVMVNVEADALVGPLLAERARQAHVVYSMAYGDQPALTCELIDALRTAGFVVTAAGKGTKYLPSFHAITPDTVWEHRGMTAEQARAAGMNARMFTSFTDGTKAAIEMAAVANAAGLAAPPAGLAFPPGGVEDLPTLMRPWAEGGALAVKGQVEVVSSVQRDGTPVRSDLRWGVFAVFEGDTDYVRRCFREYGVKTDPDGRYGALHRPFHLIGLELGVSIASVALRREPTGVPRGFRADVVAVAKRDLAAGAVLDGEGGYCVWGKCVPAADSVEAGWLPVGLAHDLPLMRAIRAGEAIRWSDVRLDRASDAVALRRGLEDQLRRGAVPANRA